MRRSRSKSEAREAEGSQKVLTLLPPASEVWAPWQHLRRGNRECNCLLAKESESRLTVPRLGLQLNDIAERATVKKIVRSGRG